MSATVQDTPEALRHRAKVSMVQGDVETAERCLAEALGLAPNDHRSIALLAEVRLSNGKLADAFTLYMRAVNAAPEIHPYKERFLELAGRGLDVVHSEELENAVAACLETPDLAGAVENWASLLMANPVFEASYGLSKRQQFDGPDSPFEVTDVQPLLRPLFLSGMKSYLVCHPVFEEFVTGVRRHLLEVFSQEGRFPGNDYTTLASALSHYALFTDFILEETEPEQTRVGALRRQIETGTNCCAATVALLACYRPLSVLANANDILETFKNDEILSDVVKAQIAGPASLRQAERSIPVLAPIQGETTQNVRGQYEEFPYPRWKTLSKHVVETWKADEFSSKLEVPLSKRPARILIAGCGTGRDAAIHSFRFPSSSITAVDVSRTSLAYASMKAKELGLENLAFMQGDILALGKIEHRFDLICCTGVLHHMEDPLAGWRILRDLLAPGGLMRIGLYSRTGRKEVAAAQEAAKRGGYPPTREGILRFRRESPRICDRGTLLGLSRLQDYYHTNMYRDLVFPSREHRFDLAQIRDMLAGLGLSFEGFYVSSDVLTKYRSMFRADRNATNLESWRQFESRYPDTFASMYIFWCRRPRV